MSLAPNESTIIELGDVYINEIFLKNDFELCFWTSTPNQKIDRDHTNDQLCQNFIINKTEEIPTKNLGIQLFPNPTSDKLFLKLEEPLSENTELYFYNNLGQNVKTISLVKEVSEVEIEVANFDNGLYFWVFQIGKETAKGKFVKM